MNGALLRATLPTRSYGEVGQRGQRRTTVRANAPLCAMRLCPPYQWLNPSYQAATRLAPVTPRKRTALILLGIPKLVRFAKIPHQRLYGIKIPFHVLQTR